METDTTAWQRWQLPVQHGTLAIWPEDGVRRYVNTFRAEHDPASQKTCEAHMTLTQPFTSTPSPRAWRKISDVLMEFNEFRVDYGPVRSFLPAPVIWLQIEPRKTIAALREALHDTGLFDLTLPHTDDFVAHMTITEGLSSGDVDEALLSRLRSEIKSGSFACRDIAYLRPDANFRFSVDRFVSLGVA